MSVIEGSLWETVFGVTERQLYHGTTRSASVTSYQDCLECALALGERMASSGDAGLREAVQTCLSFGVGRVADRCSSLGRYDPSAKMSGINNTFARQALGMIWDYGEGPPLLDRSGGWPLCVEWIAGV